MVNLNLKYFNKNKLGKNIILIVSTLVFIISIFSVFVLADDSGEGSTSIGELLNDKMLEVSNFNWDYDNANRAPLNTEWSQLLESDKPLNINETYIEDFSKPYFQSRLRPYTANYYTPDVPHDATYKFVDNAGKKSLVIETNGSIGGAFDYMEFSGMKFIDGATYTLSVDYTTLSPNRVFKFGFGANANVPYFMELSGTTVGEKKVATATFTSTTAYGLSADIHAALVIVIAGGDDPAKIQIDKMTIKRLNSKPLAINAVITGTTEVGSQLTLSYEYYQDSGIREGQTEIIWFTASDKNGKNKTLMSATYSRKSILITEAMRGYYVGAQIIPKTISPTDNGVGNPLNVFPNTSIGSPIIYGDFAIDTFNKSITEDFEKVDPNGNISFAPDIGVKSYITDESTKVITGKSLVIESIGGIKGGIFKDITFGSDKEYIVSFKYKFVTSVPSSIHIQFRAPSAGYTADTYQVMDKLELNTVKTFTSSKFKLGNYNDFILMLFDAYGKYTMVIDDLKIECFKPDKVAYPEFPQSDASTLNDLMTIGKTYTENFTKNTIGQMYSYDMSHFSKIHDERAIAGESILNDYTNASFGGIYFFGTKNMLAIGGKYRITAKYKVLTDIMPTGFYFGFTRDGGLNQQNIKVDFTGKVKNTTYDFTADYTLENFSDYYMQLFNLNGKDGSIIVVDTLTIQRIA